MPLRPFSFPLPETRFFKADSLIYKFKISGGSSFRQDLVLNILTLLFLYLMSVTILGNLDSLQPFSSAHFNVFPYKKPWEGASKVTCGEGRLRAYPFSLVLYLEKNTQNGKDGRMWANSLQLPLVYWHNTFAGHYMRSLQMLGALLQKDVVKPFLSASEPPAKRRRRDSPLEEAILKELHGDMEAQSSVSVLG
uniref:Membrane anchored junction protein n=1 Tax=Gasterosteus aculeatus aculeatus TaxID=481459 RepID=A0AAQ4PSD6_GASAC